MINVDNNAEWYAAFVKTGKEDNVKARLEYKFPKTIKFYVPKRELRERKNGKWHNVVHALFPGYILINGQIGINKYCDFKNIPDLWRLLSDKNELLTIPKQEIEIISQLMSNGEIIGSSSLYKKDEQIKIIDGPLKNMEGRIVKIDSRKCRAKVQMSFLGEDRTVDLSVNIISLVKNPE